MPVVLRIGRYRFFFYSNESQEPPHIHVKGAGSEAKYWLTPISLAANYGFKGHELNGIRAIIEEHQNELVEVWNEHHGSQNSD